jgi:hypothetical protein
MSNLTSSFLLLALAVLLLWLAVTDRLSQLLDAWDVATGKTKVAADDANSTLASATKVITGAPTVTISLPALPKLPTMANVGIL